MARARRPEDRAGLIAFAGSATVERTPTHGFSVPASVSTLSTASTNIETAVDTALAQLQTASGGRIVLFSDGRETSGDVMRAAAAAAAARVPIDIALPVSPGASRAPISIVRVAAPPQARVNEPYPISIEVEGPAAGRGEIRIDRSSGAPLVTPVTFDERGAGRVTITERQGAPGLYSYGATAITEDDPSAAAAGRSPDAGAIIAVHGQPHALYVSDAATPFAARLRSAGFQTILATSDSVPRSAAALSAYDLVVLDDVPLEALHEGAAAALAAHVNATAGGLLVMGSARSLSPAAVRSPLAAAIPIDLRPRSGRRSPPAAIVIVFDKSGSMADSADGIAKIELARQAVLDVLDVVPSTDEIGVIAFSQSAETVAPLRAGHDPRELAARLRALAPSGATAIGPAIETATGWLRDPAMASVVRRHIVLISDGRTSAADAERVRSAAAGKGIEISVVALGDSTDRAFLEEIARTSGGRAFFPRDLRQLPMLVAREAARVASGWRFDGPFQPKRTPHPLSANGSALPSLHGYVVSAAKPDAEAIALSHLDDPVLAAWRFGLGRVAVFTSDIRTADGASDAHAALDAVWIRTARWITRQAGDPDLSLTATQNDIGVLLAVEAADDRGFLDRLAVSADVRSGDGTNQRVTLEQSAPGRYEAVVAVESPGPYTASITARANTQDPNSAYISERRLIRGFYRTSPEARARGIDSALLARIASLTGGRLLAQGDNPFTGARAPGVVDLRPWLLTAALLLFFFEVTRARGFEASAGLRQWLQTITARGAAGRAA
jgi:Mg-chelatase subunit ChlD